MRWGVITFPGSCDDHDVYDSLKSELGQKVKFLWHKEEFAGNFDCVVLPGGFSYGDYLRCGAMARFSPVMRGLMKFAQSGGLVLGVCNGFWTLYTSRKVTCHRMLSCFENMAHIFGRLVHLCGNEGLLGVCNEVESLAFRIPRSMHRLRRKSHRDAERVARRLLGSAGGAPARRSG